MIATKVILITSLAVMYNQLWSCFKDLTSCYICNSRRVVIITFSQAAILSKIAHTLNFNTKKQKLYKCKKKAWRRFICLECTQFKRENISRHELSNCCRWHPSTVGLCLQVKLRETKRLDLCPLLSNSTRVIGLYFMSLSSWAIKKVVKMRIKLLWLSQERHNQLKCSIPS